MNNEVKTSEDFKNDILREQIRLVMEHVPIMQAGSFIVALVLSYVVRDIVAPASILLWVLVLFLIVLSRIALYYRFRKVIEEPFAGEYWKNLYLILTLISGIIWGASAFIIFPAGNLGLATFFVLVMASLSAATTISHSSIKWGSAAWAGPAMMPYAIRCLMEGTEFGYNWSFLIILYIFAVTRFSFIHNKSIVSAITLRFENLELFAEVQRVNDILRQDISKRMRAEELLKQSNARISHLNDVLRAIRDVGSLINTEKDPTELLKAVCNSLVQTRGYVMVWIGKPDADSKMVLKVAHSGGDGDFLQHAPITRDDSPTGRGPEGTAVRERRAVVFNDLAADQRFDPWKDPSVTYGGASIASVPIIHQESTLAVLTVKADHPHAFDRERWSF